jgi:lipopolysaccharide export LptBFGC system permease protein LptF
MASFPGGERAIFHPPTPLRRFDPLGRTLALYTIREIALPTLIAVATITFIFLIHMVHRLVSFVLLPGVKVLDVLSIMASFLPSLVIFAAPMGVLIGAIIGIGRLTLDREVLAVRAGGINLFKLFIPCVVLSLFISLLIMRLWGNEVPRMLLAGQVKLSQLEHEMITGLQPGKFHDELLEDLMGKDSGLAFYFEEHGKEPGQMLGIVIRTTTDISPEWFQEYVDEGLAVQERNKEGFSADLPDLAKFFIPESMPIDYTSTGTIKPQVHFMTTPTLAFDSPQNNLEYLKLHIHKNELYPYVYRGKEVTLIFADRGRIRTGSEDNDGDGEADTVFELILEDGALHRMTVEDSVKSYLTMNFKKANKRLFASRELTKKHKSRTNDQLREIIGNRDQHDKKSWRRARKEILDRYLMAFTFFIFTWIGIPLAIESPASGKSWGILMAIGLMLAYYLVMQTGLTWFQNEKRGGLFLTLLPNMLYFLLGILLWLRTMRF